MARIQEHPNVCAMLDAVAWSEIGPALLAASDDGYNVIVGSTPERPSLFHDYADHPHILVHLSQTLSSTAAGRYQILGKYADAYKASLDLPDFGPESQDRIAVQLIKECHAYGLVTAGQFDQAVYKCRSRWASLPGASYGQHENKIEDLRAAYENAGGALA